MKGIDLLDELFGDTSETPGARLHAQLFEGFLLAWLLTWCWRWAEEMSRFQEVIRPLGIAHYLDLRCLFGPGASWNAALVSVAALLGATRLAPRLGYTVALVGSHAQLVARYSQGKLCHDSTFVGMGVLALCCAMWLFRGASDRRRFLVGASQFLIGLAYFTAAASKLLKSGPLWVDGRHMWLWIGEKAVDGMASHGTLQVSWLQQHVLDSHTLATGSLTAGLCTELCGVLLWFRRTRSLAALACIGMHVGIYFTMDILFDVDIYLLALLALPWPRAFDALASASRAPHASLAR